MNPTIDERKRDHLRICCEEEVEFREKTTLLECVELIHSAVPEIGENEPDLGVDFMGRRLEAPFLIGAMTGGTEEAARVNRDLAGLAAARGVGFALGSQRPMLEDPGLADTFRVREVAPDIPILGNIGLYQAREVPAAKVADLMAAVGADAMCVHLNAAMEMFQDEGDRDFTAGYATLERLARALGDRLIVKETGCGISRETAERIRDCGVRWIDVGGAGGTSWVKIENIRARQPRHPSRELFDEWGIPTGASLCEVAGLGMGVIASGGIRTGLDIARAIVLGACAATAALPVLKAYHRNGAAGAGQYVDRVIDGLRCTARLCGCCDAAALQDAPRVITGTLKEWIEARSLPTRTAEAGR